MKPMKYFAAHRLWKWNREEILSICRFGLDGENHFVQATEPLDCEMERTEWIGGLVLVAPACFPRRDGESFAEYRLRLMEEWKTLDENTCSVLFAYHFVPFDIQNMEFLPSTRIFRL